VIPKPSKTEGLVFNAEDNWPLRKAEQEELVRVRERIASAIEKAD